MKSLSAKWQKLILWLTGYLNVIAFVIAGGYLYLNTDDGDVKGSAKSILLLTAGFAGLDILRSIIYNIMSLANVGYETLSAMSDVGLVISIIKAVAFVVLFILDLNGIKFSKVGKSDEKSE